MNTKNADKKIADKKMLRFGGICGLACGLLALARGASATVQGLNQIPTPDVQKPGALSIAYQQIDPVLGNRYQAQFDLGVTPRLELDVYRLFPRPTSFLGPNTASFSAGTSCCRWALPITPPKAILQTRFWKRAATPGAPMSLGA